MLDGRLVREGGELIGAQDPPEDILLVRTVELDGMQRAQRW